MKLFVKATTLSIFIGVLLMGTTQGEGVHDIIQSATDFARRVSQLCTSDAISDPAVMDFCDEAF